MNDGIESEKKIPSCFYISADIVQALSEHCINRSKFTEKLLRDKLEEMKLLPHSPPVKTDVI